MTHVISSLLSKILPPIGLYCVAHKKPSIKGLIHTFCKSYDEVESVINALAADVSLTVYLAQASYASDANRKGENALWVKCFWMDIDCGPEKYADDPDDSYPTQKEGAQALLTFCKEVGLPRPTIINSGQGLYAYWSMTEGLLPDVWKEIAMILKKLCVAYGFKVDPSRTADIASVLRPVGSTNRKYGEKPVLLLHEEDEIEFTAFASILRDAVSKKKIAASGLPPQKLSDLNSEFTSGVKFPQSSAVIVASKCQQMNAMKNTGGNLPEPLWYALLCVLRYCEDGRVKAHEWSKGHIGYSADETESKLDQSNTGPTTCNRFKSINPSLCIGCKHVVTSPIMLGIESAASDSGTARDKSNKMVGEILDVASGLELFHDQHNVAHIVLDGQCIKLSSKPVLQYLSYRVYQRTNKTPNSEALKQALSVLEGKAIFEMPKRKLENRVARHDNATICYDMGDNRAVFITAGSWQIDTAPILFRRHKHQETQITPATGGDVKQLFDFFNVASANMLLILVTLISYFIPGIPHPIFHPFGPHGAGKTSLFKGFKLIVDPSTIATLMCSNDRHKVLHVLVTHYMPLFDNLSGLTGEISDLLCQACTGGGIEQRQLYTDDESIIFEILRCVGLNGINISTVRADLLDRTLLLQMERIEPAQRREEGELWAAFELARPHILGGIFNTLAKAMQIYPTVRLDKLPRLADFGRWGYAIAEALEQGAGQKFILDYEANIKLQGDEIIHGNTLATTLLSVMQSRVLWETTIKQAYEQLKAEANFPKHDDHTFPNASKSLRNHLERLRPTLVENGISYSIGERATDGYPIIFRKAV